MAKMSQRDRISGSLSEVENLPGEWLCQIRDFFFDAMDLGPQKCISSEKLLKREMKILLRCKKVSSRWVELMVSTWQVGNYGTS